MTNLNLVGGVTILVVLCVYPIQCQNSMKFSLDVTKPFVYIEFDHAGPRPPVEDGEPPRGFWLKITNNSVVPIELETMDTATNPTMLLLPDVITPQERIISKLLGPRARMPAGYTSRFGRPSILDPGKSLIFSVPANHIAPTWYIRVPFRFRLPALQHGVQPVCFAQFEWEDIPDQYRSTQSTHSKE